MLICKGHDGTGREERDFEAEKPDNYCVQVEKRILQGWTWVQTAKTGLGDSAMVAVLTGAPPTAWKTISEG